MTVGGPCLICRRKRMLIRSDGSYIRCWACRKRCGYILLGRSEPWVPKDVILARIAAEEADNAA